MPTRPTYSSDESIFDAIMYASDLATQDQVNLLLKLGEIKTVLQEVKTVLQELKASGDTNTEDLIDTLQEGQNKQDATNQKLTNIDSNTAPSGGGGGGAGMVCMNEHLNRKDMDRNGKIYGIDFIFSDPTPLIEGLNNQLKEKTPGITEITVAAYEQEIAELPPE